LALCIQSAGVLVAALVDVGTGSVEWIASVAWQTLAGMATRQVSADGSLSTAATELALVNVNAFFEGVAREPGAA
jgi:hypothetical protein